MPILFLQEKSNSSILFPDPFWDYICILFSPLFSFSAMRVRLREFWNNSSCFNPVFNVCKHKVIALIKRRFRIKNKDSGTLPDISRIINLFYLLTSIINEWLKQFNFSINSRVLNFWITMTSITKRSMFSSFTHTKPNFFVFWSNISDGSTYDIFPHVFIFASGIAKWLRMATTTSTPSV